MAYLLGNKQCLPMTEKEQISADELSYTLSAVLMEMREAIKNKDKDYLERLGVIYESLTV
jgi:hypothetical protein